ncbi:MAG: hypothetical protein IPP44_16515 [Ideonella sp.]|nr:hypothetical protein [Ideonella sp.]
MSKFLPFLRSAGARHVAAALIVASTLIAGPSVASVWTEQGDAGQTQATAQQTYSNGPAASLDSIGGSFGSMFDVDLYLIHIVNPGAFSATTVGGTLMDTQLFLFSLGGAGIYMNDDDPLYAMDANSFLLSTLVAGSVLGPVAEGFYLLGISLNGNDPTNGAPSNDLLFASGLSTEIRGPNGSISPAVLGGFTGTTNFDEQGAYTIKLTGVSAVPEPASGLLAALASGLCVLVSRKGSRKAAATKAA